MATKHRDSSYKLNYNCVSRIETMKTNGTIWYRGIVVTPDGIVNVLYSEPKGTLIAFVHNGRLHDRRWDRQFQPRYLTNLARKFAAEITAKEPTNDQP